MAKYTWKMTSLGSAENVRRQLIAAKGKGVSEIYRNSEGFFCVDVKNGEDEYGWNTFNRSPKKPKHRRFKHGTWYAHKVVGCQCWKCLKSRERCKTRNRKKDFEW